jgi:DNA-binding response OmpR family regulator
MNTVEANAEPVRIDRLTVTLEEPGQAFVDDKPLMLWVRALQLLQKIARQKGKYVDPKSFIDELYEGKTVHRNITRVLVNHLRERISEATKGPDYIYSRRGRGYMLNDNPNEDYVRPGIDIFVEVGGPLMGDGPGRYPLLVVNIAPHGIATVDGEPVRLRPAELKMLKIYAKFKSKVLPNTMVRDLLDASDSRHANIVDYNLSRLRKNLQRATGGHHYIETVVGRGHVLTDFKFGVVV